MLVDIVGPICETGDILGKERKFPSKTSYDDVIIICNAGAYGHTMSSNYNLKKTAKEYFISNE
jgi:bifunctional diaminopimelate decarboxylase / aspartate kinase